MAVTRLNPRTIWLGGPKTLVSEYPASAAITPGDIIELHSDSGTLSWRPQASATVQATLAVALEAEHLNDDIDTAYAASDQVVAAFLAPGSVFYGRIPSGRNIAVGDYLQSNGDGMLKEATASTADANVARFQALDALGATTVTTRCRVQVIS